MTQDEIIRMAREASNTPIDHHATPDLFGVRQIERFAALVAAHEREKIPKDFVKACEVLVQEKNEAVLAEREACAKVCEETESVPFNGEQTIRDIAAAIRARGEK